MKNLYFENLRKDRKSIPGMYYLITKCCYKKELLLIPNINRFEDSQQIFSIIKFTILYLEIQKVWRVISFVMMPDHFHLIVQLGKKKSLSQAVRSLTNFVFKEYHKRYSKTNKLWQKDFHEYMIKNGKSLENIIEYVIESPLRNGYVKSTNMWPFSILRF